MTFLVEFTRNNVACAMEIEAADLETAKQAVNQWRVDRLRYRGGQLRIDAITEKQP